MLFHYFIEFFLSNVMAYFAHRIDYIVLGYCARTICVKLVEDCLEHSVVQELLHVQGRHYEFCVVYLPVPLVVHLVYYLVDLLVRDVNVTCLDSFFKLAGIYQPCSILIDLNEFFPEFLNLVLVSHLHEHIHCSFLKFAHSFERLQALNYVPVNLIRN